VGFLTDFAENSNSVTSDSYILLQSKTVVNKHPITVPCATLVSIYPAECCQMNKKNWLNLLQNPSEEDWAIIN